MTFDLINLIILGLGFVILTLLLNKKFDLIHEWEKLFYSNRALFLVVLPPMLTYFAVCGMLSLATVELYTFSLNEKENFNEDDFMMWEHLVEWICSLLLPYLYLRWVQKSDMDQKLFWESLITSTHVIVAGYRDPMLILVKEPFYRETGPVLLGQIEWLDASIPLIPFIFFLWINAKDFYHKKHSWIN